MFRREVPRHGRSAHSPSRNAAAVVLVLVAHAALICALLWVTRQVQPAPASHPLLVRIVAAQTSVPAAAPPARPRRVMPAAPLTQVSPSQRSPRTATPPPDAGSESPRSEPTASSVEASGGPPELPSTRNPARDEAAPAELAVLCDIRVAPSYPAAARQRGETGLVIVRVEIDERGVLASSRLERSSGHLALDEAALQAVQSWRCTPPVHHGVPVKGVALQPFNFSLGR